MVLAFFAATAIVAVSAPGCGGGCAVAAGSTADLTGNWRGGCGTDTECQVVDDSGSLTINCPGFGSCSGDACGSDISLDCTSALDGSSLSGDLKLSSDDRTITGTLTGGVTGDCNVIFQKQGGHGPK